MGRKKIDFKWDVLDAVLQFNPSKVDVADIMGCSQDVIARRIKKKYKCTYTEYKNRRMAHTRVKLAQKQLDVAIKGNVTMLIWLGKQYLRQTDKVETEQNSNITVNYTVKEKPTTKEKDNDHA